MGAGRSRQGFHARGGRQNAGAARIAWVDQTVTATIADGELARRLALPLGAPVLRLARTVHDAEDRPIEALDARYRADSYASRVRLGRHARADQAI
jgi:DNA-binding GntR family transcriptional regulator